MMIPLQNRESMPNTSPSGPKSYLMKRTTDTIRSIVKHCLSNTSLFDGYLINSLFTSQGQSTGHLVLYRRFSYFKHFYTTLKLSKTAKSYLTTRLGKAQENIMKQRLPVGILYDERRYSPVNIPCV